MVNNSADIERDVLNTTISFHAIGGILNLIVFLSIIKRWPERKLCYSLSLSLASVYILLNGSKGIFIPYKDQLKPYALGVFSFWCLALQHVIGNLVLILTVQRVLAVVVKPHWVRVTVTRKSSDKCVTMHWIQTIALYSPVVMVQFLMKKDDLEELMAILNNMVTLIIFAEAFLIFMLALTIFFTFIAKGTLDFEENPTLAADENTLHWYWLWNGVFYYLMIPSVAYTFDTLTFSSTLEMVDSMSGCGMAISFVWFYLFLKSVAADS